MNPKRVQVRLDLFHWKKNCYQCPSSATGVASSSTPNLPERNKTKAGKSHLTSVPINCFVSSRTSSTKQCDPANFNTSQSQSSRRRCSPCSESVFSCFNSLRRPPTLALSLPPPVVPAQRIPSLRSATTNQVSTPSSSLQWNDRSTDDLVRE